ncbi:hypothetical protein [[Flexibacter] sp. ATCC 35208]|uniref:hypothetical protein n=1 Tax=[Flexibacter] sp. ATCC 35208 TaxID=1936242 RepID=UPI0009D60EDC|nr:hypothetical protein [[Flexibacter] sp. ATCC 35208]OMP81019.1 hypothetical protein BW716_00055 [[Flexibacter] sp. ATCC 35208]
MKGIITVLIFICFFQDGIGQQNSPKAVMPKKQEEVKKGKVVPASEKKVVHAVDKKAVPASEKKVVHAVDKKVVPAPEKKVVHAVDKKVVHTPEKKVVHPVDKKIVPAPVEKKVVPAAEKKIVPAPVETIVAVPVKKEEPTAVDVDSSPTREAVVDTNLIKPAVETASSTQPITIPPPEVIEAGTDWQTWASCLSMLLIIGMGIYVFITNSNIHRRLWGIEKKLNKMGMPLDWEKAKSPAGITPTEVERLIACSPVLKSIQDEYATLKEHVEKLQQPAPRVVAMNTPVIPEESAGGTFYMTGPTGNSFPSSARSNHRENTVYKFYLQPGGTEARFELHTTGASINDIIKVIESYIKPACDEENLPMPGTRNIVTRKQGVAFLENDKWIIKAKAVIRYE